MGIIKIGDTSFKKNPVKEFQVYTPCVLSKGKKITLILFAPGKIQAKKRIKDLGMTFLKWSDHPVKELLNNPLQTIHKK